MPSRRKAERSLPEQNMREKLETFKSAAGGEIGIILVGSKTEIKDSGMEDAGQPVIAWEDWATPTAGEW
jgi:hypothetical protein